MEDILDQDVFGNLSESEFEFYKSFHSVEKAKDFVALLQSHNLPYKADTARALIDETIVGTGLMPKVVIKLLPNDFKTVNELIKKEIVEADYREFGDHYLNQLDDEELLAIFEKQDEWSVEDIHVAQIILRNRGIKMDDVDVKILREVRLAKIRKGKEGNKVSMAIYFVGILLGLVTFWVFAIAGIGMGYYYSYGKTVDPDGKSYYIFEPNTRRIGKFILYGGLVALIAEVIVLGYLRYFN